MKILHTDFKKGEVKVEVQNLDDLWYLHTIIEQGDLVKGKTLRKIKVGESGDTLKRAVFISIKTQRIEFSQNAAVLRIGGIIIESSSEDVPHGEHHTFSVESGSVISIQKEHWLSFLRQKLQESTKDKGNPVLLCVFDRDEAYIALLKSYGYEMLVHLQGDVKKKRHDTVPKKHFFTELAQTLASYQKRFGSPVVIVGSPAFWKDELLKVVSDGELKKKIILATCHSASPSGIHEMLRRPEVASALTQQRMVTELVAAEMLLTAIAKQGNGTYGIAEVKKAGEMGAVETLLVTDTLIKKMREEKNFSELEKIMRAVEAAKGTVMIVSSEHDGGQKLDGLGGIGAILRYRVG